MLQRLGEIQGNEEGRERNLVFVGYSYGGLVLKKALVQANQNAKYTGIIAHTMAVLFLGTPHRGSDISCWGKRVASLLQPFSSNPSILQELAYDSISLHDLHKEFTLAAVNIPSITNFYERRKTRIFKVWWLLWEDFCVRQQSATFPGAPTQVKDRGLATDHKGLNKFASRDSNYELILKELQGVIKPFVLQRQRSLYSAPIKPARSYTRRASLSNQIQEKLHTT